MKVQNVEQACLNLTDTQIESLLSENVKNMHFAAHYKLADRPMGWDTKAPHGYNGYNPFRRIYLDDLTYVADFMKSNLEHLLYPPIKLVLTAVKTIDFAHFAGHGSPVENSKYSKKASCVVGNMIFYDTRSGKFHALPQWIGSRAYIDVRTAVELSAYDFMRNFTRVELIDNSPVVVAVMNGIRQHSK